MTLYLKYRPQTIDQLDLASVRESLKKILSSDNPPHAFLFSGPRGAGKTSAARIVAKALNCTNLQNGEPCNECEQCTAINNSNHVDIIEMDAASNRGIDDIRALRESVGLSPQSAKKKIYIIDEAHMLTTEAANAFLKTLEEPPSHVQFIFATTDPQKLPDTIKSRLHTVHFTKANSEEISRQLERVINGEKLKVEPGVVELISKTVDGSFRDAVKKLEGLSLENEEITLKLAEKYLFSSDDVNADTILSLLSRRDIKNTLESVGKYADDGGDIKLLIEQLMEKLRHHAIAEYGVGDKQSLDFSSDQAITLIEKLIEAKGNVNKTHLPQIVLELAILKFSKEIDIQPPKKVEPPAPVKKNSEKITGDASSVEDILEKKIQAMKHVPSNDVKISSGNGEVWPQILARAREVNTTVEALLRAAELIEFNGENLRLGVYYQFHKEKLESGKNREILDSVVSQVCGPVKLTLSLTEPHNSNGHVNNDTLTDTSDQDIIQAAKEIFGD